MTIKICVFGLFHLGLVTAACLYKKGFEVVGLDPDETTVYNINVNDTGLPISEPYLKETIQEGMFKRKLHFTNDIKDALKNTDVVWICFDTPVDNNDKADVTYVMNQVRSLFVYLEPNSVVIISSQLPVGSTRSIEAEFASKHAKSVTFAYSPENLRLGTALETFNNPDRIVVGVCFPQLNKEGKTKIENVLKAISKNIEWMSAESAEMTKHSLNAFLATSISFANEVALICEQVGANYKEVERGLKSDLRIGKNAYLKSGSAYAGGTLARDIVFLNDISYQNNLRSFLLKAVNRSNNEHKLWTLHTLDKELKGVEGKNIAVLGLTYKPNTNTLRRSNSISLCNKLVLRKCIVKCHDPLIKKLPKNIKHKYFFNSSINRVISNVDAIVIATECEEYKTLTPDMILKTVPTQLVIDPNGFLEKQLGNSPNKIRYVSVGRR